MEIAATQALVRFGFGPGPAEKPASDPRGALKAQLLGPDPGLASGAFAGLPSGGEAVDLRHADTQLRHEFLKQPDKRPAYRNVSVAMYQYEGVAQLNQAVMTPSSFRERLVWFWANHFSVGAHQNNSGPLIGAMIREAIRPHATGKFVDMVLAVERHPAMLVYLDNVGSVGPNSRIGRARHKGLNENLGRECMELHTVGLAAGYTQTDVTNMAKILTGWSVATSQYHPDATGFKYHAAAHEPGAQTVMGRSFDGGEQAGIDALRFLATYPTTYDMLARKLVTHFVADEPPPDDVAKIAGILKETDGDLAAASAALVDLPGAWTPGTKLKTPSELFVSMLRAAPPPHGPPVAAPPIFTGTLAQMQAANEALLAAPAATASRPKAAPGPHPINPFYVLNQLGQPLWNAPLPNGWPDVAAPWASSDGISDRIDWAYTYSGRLDHGDTGPQPANVAQAALGPLLRPATVQAMAQAGSRREAYTLFLSSPEFQRR